MTNVRITGAAQPWSHHSSISPESAAASSWLRNTAAPLAEFLSAEIAGPGQHTLDLSLSRRPPKCLVGRERPEAFSRDVFLAPWSDEYMIVDFYQILGWTYGLIAFLFALGLATPIARHFYPDLPSFRHRLAAPLIFGAMALACFIGFGHAALLLVSLPGLILIAVSHWRRRSGKRAG